MTKVFTEMTAPEAARFMVRKFDHPIRDAAADIIGDKRLLDVGCGRGIRVKELYHPNQYFGIDCSSELIRLARMANPDHRFRCADGLTALSIYEYQSVDAVLMISVMEHMESLEAAQEMYRQGARVGRTFVVGWNHPPHYPQTEILTVKAELDRPINQNRYKEGSFDDPDLQVESRRIGSTELWTVTRR